MKLEILLNNCFGIGKLEHSFDLSIDNNTVMIYAPNGTMKTSLARTFMCLEKKHNAADLLDETKVSSYSFILDGKEIDPIQVYVYKTENNQIEQDGISMIERDNILSFLSSPNEVQHFQEIIKPLDDLLFKFDEEFNKSVNHGNYVFFEEILKVYKHHGILAKYDSVYDAIKHAKDLSISNCIFDGILYDELFDKHCVSAKYIRDYYEELLDANKRKKVKVESKKRWNRICIIIDTHSYIKERINDLESLRRDYLLSFINKRRNSFLSFSNLYVKKKKELFDIIKKVIENSQIWKQMILRFKNRFIVPYDLELKNIAEIILNHDTPYVNYIHSNSTENKNYKSKEFFLNFISTGEKRAYYLLLNMFEIEKRKIHKEKQIIVIDDIAESFDYQNKYAIIEYLADLKECKNFILIILTHNFDFYRTVHSRLNVSNIFIAHKDKERNISLQKGLYVRDIIKNILIKNIDKSKFIIALIPFVRNIVEYTKGDKSQEYIKLTSYLHAMSETPTLTMTELVRIFYANIYLTNKASINYTSQKYLGCLFNEAEEVFKSNDIIAIENKLVLSIAIRIKAELFMKQKLIDMKEIPQEYRINQTKFLFEKYRAAYPAKEKECVILRKVLMMTSEIIHINNFMFEPIIDISLEEFKKLYEEIKSLE